MDAAGPDPQRTSPPAGPGSAPATPPPDDVRDDVPHEECGVFGVWAPGEDVAKLTYFGLFALQIGRAHV